MSMLDQARLAVEFGKRRLHLEDEVAGPMLAFIVWFVLVVFLSAVIQQPGD